MIKEDHNRRFRLHFQGPSTVEHTVPASALVDALRPFQRVVHLLAMADEGKEVRLRGRITREIERRFPVLCRAPESGGYALPVDVGDPRHQLFDREAVDRISARTAQVISAVNRGDQAELKQLIPETYFRRSVLLALDTMQPPKRLGVVVNIEDFREQRLLDGNTAKTEIEKLLGRTDQDVTGTPGYVTGTLIEMKFQERRLRLQLLGGRALDASYSDDFEPILLEHPRELIQVHGNIVYGEDGLPSSVSDVDEILEVDESPIEVSEIARDDLVLRAIQPLAFSVIFDRGEQLYEVHGPFGIALSATARPELEAELEAELAMLWHEYARADPARLTKAADDLREALLQMFEDETYAA